MFDFDEFINKPCFELFGIEVEYIPCDLNISPFIIEGDFHEAYVNPDLKRLEEIEISSVEIVLFIQEKSFPENYLKPKQGDYLLINQKRYQVINIAPHIPGSKKLTLHKELS